ncbi:MAG: homocysteine S-methyltransferase family protein [Ruminococcaceae bacterium]|nr:homocysteine S-methyltransferase family protein [Oscillospiraceae bacterium]
MNIFSFGNLPVILDGATGTELIKRGLHQGVCVEKWIIDNESTITDVQKNYFSSGSDCVYAATFGANRAALKKYSLENSVEDINLKLVSLSKSVSDKLLIGGDLSPTGKMLLPYGDTELEEMIDIYRQQAKALEKANVDFFAIETMMSLAEARAAVIAVKEVSDKPIIVTMTVEASGKTMNGNSVLACLCTLQEMGISAFGLNCSVSPQQILDLLIEASPYAKIPLIAKPNAGVPTADGQTKQLSPDDFADFAKKAIQNGIGILGGCCGTSPDHIKAIKNTVSSLEYKRPILDSTAQIILTTQKSAFFLSEDFNKSEIFKCTDDLPENILDAEDDGCDVFCVEINSQEDIEIFESYSYMFNLPVYIITDSIELLEKVAQGFCGRIMVESNDSLDAVKLEALTQKYGIIVF